MIFYKEIEGDANKLEELNKKSKSIGNKFMMSTLASGALFTLFLKEQIIEKFVTATNEGVQGAFSFSPALETTFGTAAAVLGASLLVGRFATACHSINNPKISGYYAVRIDIKQATAEEIVKFTGESDLDSAYALLLSQKGTVRLPSSTNSTGPSPAAK